MTSFKLKGFDFHQDAEFCDLLFAGQIAYNDQTRQKIQKMLQHKISSASIYCLVVHKKTSRRFTRWENICKTKSLQYAFASF